MHLAQKKASMSNEKYNNTFQQCRILFSTQSGRAKACARRTARILREQTTLQVHQGTTFDAWVAATSNNPSADHTNLESFASELQTSRSLLVLFVSTTGDGEHTDTIQETWKLLLQKSLPPDLFAGVRFAIFCLGDRAYGHLFCGAGRKLAVRLLQLGATLCCQAGYGDDGTPNGGVFADLDAWIDQEFLEWMRSESILQSEVNNPSVAVAANTTGVNKVCNLPYTVTVVDEAPIDSVTTTESDIQCLFNRAYDDFAARQSPRSAYIFDAHTGERLEGDVGSFKPPLNAKVTRNERMTDGDWGQNTRNIRITVPFNESRRSSVLPYRAGDVAVILPSNSKEEVERFLSVLPHKVRMLADRTLTIEHKASKTFNGGICYPHWPGRCTLRSWLTFCADIHAIPEREDLRALSFFCSKSHPSGITQSQKLVSLGETKEAALYADYILREKRSWVDVIYDFDSLRDSASTLSIEALLAILSPIRSRDFSIASSPTLESLSDTSPGINIELCVAVVEGSTPLGRAYNGLCSSYLSRLDPNSKPEVRIWIKPGSFSGLPLGVIFEDSGEVRFQAPVLLIGAGTGIAPLRSLLLERNSVLHLQLNHEPSKSGSILDRHGNVLVFGCRKKDADFYYGEELRKLEEDGNLELLLAFSQEEKHKVYVQQVLQSANATGNFVTKILLELSGAIYIAGNPNMAKAVKEVILESLAAVLDGGESQAKQVLARLNKRGRFSVEAWG